MAIGSVQAARSRILNSGAVAVQFPTLVKSESSTVPRSVRHPTGARTKGAALVVENSLVSLIYLTSSGSPLQQRPICSRWSLLRRKTASLPSETMIAFKAGPEHPFLSAFLTKSFPKTYLQIPSELCCSSVRVRTLEVSVSFCSMHFSNVSSQKLSCLTNLFTKSDPAVIWCIGEAYVHPENMAKVTQNIDDPPSPYHTAHTLL